MLRGPDWTRTRAVVTAFMEPEERPVALFTALVPPPEWGGQIVDVIVAPLVWVAWHATWRRSAHAASRAAGVALTPRRMVVWQASRRWRLGAMAGELPRDLIAGATAPPGGTRSRALVLRLATGQAVTLRVWPATADDLAAQLSRHRDDSCVPENGWNTGCDPALRGAATSITHTCSTGGSAAASAPVGVGPAGASQLRERMPESVTFRNHPAGCSADIRLVMHRLHAAGSSSAQRAKE